MIRFASILGTGCASALLLVGSAAFAQTPPPAAPPAPPPDGTPPKLDSLKKDYVDVKVDDAKRKQGWDPRASVGGTAAFIDNRNVIGQATGSTLSVGFKFGAGLDYNDGPHEWRNTLDIGAGVTRTPTIPEFVKTRDTLAFESIYLYHVAEWWGFYGRATLATAMFRGADVRPAPVTYAITQTDGTVVQQNASRLTLSDPFRPLTLKQGVGPFLRPVTSEKVNVELRAGAGAHETFAKNQLALNDDSSTPEIEVKQLDNAFQVGAEASAEVWGAVSDKKVTYKVYGEVLVPFAHNALPPGDDRSALQLTDIELGGNLSFKLVDWASLDYDLKAIRQPQLLDAFQVQNNLLFTIGVTLKESALTK